jgi:hypothetical protein
MSYLKSALADDLAKLTGEGWASASGDTIEITCADFDPLYMTVP